MEQTVQNQCSNTNCDPNENNNHSFNSYDSQTTVIDTSNINMNDDNSMTNFGHESCDNPLQNCDSKNMIVSNGNENSQQMNCPTSAFTARDGNMNQRAHMNTQNGRKESILVGNNNRQRINSLGASSTASMDCTSTSLKVPILGYEVIEERSRFTVYKLKVEDPTKQKSWLVFRRYTDFVRLDTKLREANPNIRLPLPGKRFFKDNFETMFLEQRTRSLQIYINELIKHFSTNPLVRDFLCLDEPPLFRYRTSYNLEQSIEALSARLKDIYNIVHSCENCSSKLRNIK